MHTQKTVHEDRKKRSQSTTNKSALTDHTTTKKHKVVNRESYGRRRHVKDEIWIRKAKAAINRDDGNYELPHVHDNVI